MVVTIFLAFWLVCNTACADDQQEVEDPCREIIASCDDLVASLKEQNTLLQGQRDRAVQEASKLADSTPLLPAWAYIGLGVLAGGLAVSLIKR